MVRKDKVVVLENVGGVDEDTHRLNRNPTTNVLDVENIHLQCDNDFVENDKPHLLVIATQVHKWKPNNKTQFVGGFS
jgi:hypothetical protein